MIPSKSHLRSFPFHLALITTSHHREELQPLKHVANILMLLILIHSSNYLVGNKRKICTEYGNQTVTKGFMEGFSWKFIPCWQP